MSYYEEKPPVQIPIPFLRRRVRAGDAVARATGAVGIQPCGACKERQARMNRRLVFVPMRRR